MKQIEAYTISEVVEAVLAGRWRSDQEYHSRLLRRLSQLSPRAPKDLLRQCQVPGFFEAMQNREYARYEPGWLPFCAYKH